MADAAWTDAEWKDAAKVVMGDPAWAEFVHALIFDLRRSCAADDARAARIAKRTTPNTASA